MRIGKLTERVVIQSATETQSATGEVTQSWSTVATVWAQVSPLTGKEFFSSQHLEAEVNAVIRIRYRTGITPKMRVTHGSDTYDIMAVLQPDSANRETHLMCVKKD
jgi:SPP1 family predicted phage head-tail adaptor